MAVNFFSLEKQNQALRNELDEAIKSVVDSGHFILGKNVSALEQEIAAYCQAKHGSGVASGTDALLIALRACGVSKGDEVITTPFTFVATIGAIANIGATPVFADININNFNLDPAKIEARITKKTRAILPVHLFGQSADMAEIMRIAQKHNLKVIEDSAQSIGAKCSNKMVGSIGDTGCLSFFPTKNLGGFGDGGMITTNNDKIADEAKVLRGHGSRQTYLYDIIGYNSRLDEIQAAILRVRLKYLNSWSEKRRKNAALYNRLLSDVKEISLPVETPYAYHVYNQYTILSKKRDELKKHLADRKIGAMVYYPLSLHLQHAYAYLGYKSGNFPVSELAQQQVLSLPIYPELTEDEINEVASAIRAFYKN